MENMHWRLIEVAPFLAAAMIVLACSPGANAAGPASQPERLTVFILAGQSNMNGAGQSEQLPVELRGPLTNVLFAQFWGVDFKPLEPAKVGKSFGPEVTFGLEMAAKLNRPVGLIKIAYGGSNLEKDWNPLAYDKEKNVGVFYKRLIDYVKGIQKKHPEVRIAGMLWMQGENDSRYHAKTVEQYRDKLEALIDGCRKEFGVADMPFVAGRVNPPNWPFQANVRKAQETASRPGYAWFDCDDIELGSDKLHFTTNGQIELGKRFAAAMLKLMSHPTPTTQAGK